MPPVTGDDEVLGAEPIDDRLPGVIGGGDVHPEHWFQRLEEISIARFGNSGWKIFTGSQWDDRLGGCQFVDDLHGNTNDRRVQRLEADFDRPRGFFDLLLHATESAENNPHTHEFHRVLAHPPLMSSEYASKTAGTGYYSVYLFSPPGFSVAASQNWRNSRACSELCRLANFATWRPTAFNRLSIASSLQFPSSSKTSSTFATAACSGTTHACNARPTLRSALRAPNAPMLPPETPTNPIILPSNSSKPIRSKAFFSTPL